ncbi:hypothetical protein BDW68DRAFT_183249 [Aspergillus falconensis]
MSPSGTTQRPISEKVRRILEGSISNSNEIQVGSRCPVILHLFNRARSPAYGRNVQAKDRRMPCPRGLHNGGPYVLETLMLYVAVELFLRGDTEIGIWILLGNIVQLVMHMGYHRDPKHFGDMSPFAAETRKRVWTTAVELDLGFSAQMRLPRLIKYWQSDTGEPLDLHDNDFAQATTNMPRHARKTISRLCCTVLPRLE